MRRLGLALVAVFAACNDESAGGVDAVPDADTRDLPVDVALDPDLTETAPDPEVEVRPDVAGDPDIREADLDIDRDPLIEADVGADVDSEVDAGPSVAECPVPPMTELYPGTAPPNPFGPWPEADDCISREHDVIVVLGSPNDDDGSPSDIQEDRADMAVELMEAGYGNRFIVTGGAVANEWVEAETLRDLLVARGVPESDIWLEPLAQHTDENFYYSSVIMQEQGWTTAMIVSESAGQLMFTALCDSNCCVELGRLTLLAFDDSDGFGINAGHYVLYPDAQVVSSAECGAILTVTKFMCTNLGTRLACADNFQL